MSKNRLGDRDFYRQVLKIAIPIIIQNGITTFVSLLDNIMVGQTGTTQMGGVAVVNQLLFIFNLCIFGTVSGAGIFTAQYFGAKDHRGIRYTFRFKVLAGLLFSAVGIFVFSSFREPLVQLYLRGEGAPEDIADTLKYSGQYLTIMLFGLVPFALSNAYSSTLRECGQTNIPMVAGSIAVGVNLVFNYILIFGNFGCPALGVRGAAIATVLSRFVELGVVAVWTHRHHRIHPFIRGAYRGIYIPGTLLKGIVLRGTPLILNETMWGAGIAFMNQCYSTCSLNVMNAVNISETIMNLTSVVTMTLGNTIGILMGQYMGQGLTREEIQEKNRKLIGFSILCGVLFGALQASIAGVFPKLYNTTDAIRSLATQLILVTAVMKPINSLTFCTYFTLRSGGKTLITSLYDSGLLWCASIPLAYCLTQFTDLPILPVFILCQSVDFLKAALGVCMVKKGTWIQNLTV